MIGISAEQMLLVLLMISLLQNLYWHLHRFCQALYLLVAISKAICMRLNVQVGNG